MALPAQQSEAQQADGYKTPAGHTKGVSPHFPQGAQVLGEGRPPLHAPLFVFRGLRSERGLRAELRKALCLGLEPRVRRTPLGESEQDGPGGRLYGHAIV